MVIFLFYIFEKPLEIWKEGRRVKVELLRKESVELYSQMLNEKLRDINEIVRWAWGDVEAFKSPLIEATAGMYVAH